MPRAIEDEHDDAGDDERAAGRERDDAARARVVDVGALALATRQRAGAAAVDGEERAAGADGEHAADERDPLERAQRMRALVRPGVERDVDARGRAGRDVDITLDVR